MKSAEHRDLVVAAVKAAFDEYRTFDSLPKVRAGLGNVSWKVKDVASEASYVAALYELFNVAPETKLIGREGDSVVSAE